MKTIEFLFPELVIYGDTYNIEFMKKCNEDINVVYTSIVDKPYFLNHQVDMVYLGSMSENSQEVAIEKLREYVDKIKELIGKKVVFLVTGNASEIFGKSIIRNDKVINALNVFDYETKYDYSARYHDLYMGSFDDLKVIGFKAQFSYLYQNKEEPFFQTITGIGNNTKEINEGVHFNNYYSTMILGPLFIYNPLLCKYFLRLLGLDDSLAYEKDVIEAYNKKMEFYLK